MARRPECVGYCYHIFILMGEVPLLFAYQRVRFMTRLIPVEVSSLQIFLMVT